MQKKRICFIVMIIIIFGIHINTWAFDLETSINTPMLEEKKIELTLKLSDLEDYTNGINVVSGKLKYDSDVFENISLTGMNNWTCAYNNEKGNDNEGKFILMTTAGNVKADTEVAKIKLELKSDINNLQTKIKMQEIQTSYQSEKIDTEDKEFNFIIVDNNIKLVENNKEEKKTELIAKDTSVENNILEDRKQNNQTIMFLMLAIILAILIILIILIINKKRRERNEK